MKTIELQAAKSHVKLSLQVLKAREKRLENTTTKLSRHYSTMKHTTALIYMLEEVWRFMGQDPETWDDEPDEVPF